MDHQFQKTSQDEVDLFYRMEGEEAEQHGFIGYLRGDYGRSGLEFHTTWFDSQPDLKTDVFREEFNEVIDYLREASLDPVEGPDAFKFDCLQNMRFGMMVSAVRFKIVTEGYSYYFRCQPGPGNYNLYCVAYDNRFLLPVLEKPNKAASLYKTGADYWKTAVEIRGPEAALAVCGDYLSAQLGQELTREENKFCRELFAAMFEATAGRTDPARLIYPYPVQQAKERYEESSYYDGLRRNSECASAIDAAINGSYYKMHHYNLDIAAMMAIHAHGFPRVNAVLAHVLLRQSYDGRYSSANKKWAQEYSLLEKAFERTYLNAHPTLIDSFVDRVRKLYTELNAERFALPGQPESGEVLEGYEITRAITFADNRGFAIAEHPRAGFVCWQFRGSDGARDYQVGHYCENEQSAAANYIARIVVHMSGDTREEPEKAPAPEPQPPPQRKPRDRREDR